MIGPWFTAVAEFVSYDHDIGASVNCNVFCPLSIDGSSKATNPKYNLKET